MGNAFVAGLKNEAPRGRDVTNEDRNSEASQRGTQRDAGGSELSYNCIVIAVLYGIEISYKLFTPEVV